jgi:hypothetical protein
MNVLAELGMVRKRRSKGMETSPFITNRSYWLRANESGMVQDRKHLGDHVNKGEVLADIYSPTGGESVQLLSTKTGIIIGKQNIPLVQEGDAMFHIATFEAPEEVAEHIEQMQDELLPEPNMDEEIMS